MGHKTIAMTCRYAHLAPQHQLDAVSKLDGWGKKISTATDTKTDTGEIQGSEAAPVEDGSNPCAIMAYSHYAKVAELADAPDLGSGPARGGGSSPPFRTSYQTVQ